MPAIRERTLDEVDRELLNVIQTDFPVTSRPFAALGDRVGGLSEVEIIGRIGALKEGRIIRQISLIFDTRALGYRSSLVATRAPKGRTDEAAAIINEHPGVSHNYRRNHEFDIWWTIAVPPASDLEAHVDRIHDLCKGESTRVLYTIRMFKIGVDLDMTGRRAADARSTIPAYRASPKAGEPLTEREIALLRELQEDIPLDPAPFALMAERAGTSEQEVIEAAGRFIEDGRARRYAAVLYHRHAGFTANAMTVWKVPAERIEECGLAMAGFAAVSHCYQRPTYPDWPYNLFGMLHGRSREECEEAADAIAREIGITERAMLYSTKEYKKVRVRYYTPEFFAWEQRHLGAA